MEQRTERRRRTLRAKIDRYLDASGLARRAPKIVPLTGDASDRRYFRVLLSDGDSVVLALHAGPIDFATLPFANVAELLHKVPLPVPRILGHSNDGRPGRAGGPRRRHAAGAPRRRVDDRARGAVPRGRRAHRAAAAARGRARLRALSALPDRVRRREADVGARLLRAALHRGIPGRRAVGGGARRRCRASGRRSPASWRRNPACCAIATITAAT